VNVIGVEKDGRVSEGYLSRALEKHPDARFVAVMGVNNETGGLMDMKALVSLARSNREAPVHVHCDLVQAIGKVPVDISGWDPDSASFSAHKLGGPRGIGLLYLKKPLEPLFAGGEQEGGIRPGTENTLGALALADVLERRANPGTVKAEELKARERFKYLIGKLKEFKLPSGKQRCTLIPEEREEDDKRFSPWILQVRFRDVPGAVMVRALDDSGIAVSTGSACSSSSPERPVLTAMGLDENARLEGIRISQGWSTDQPDLDALLSGIEKALAFL
jgi:cysteine desulfurase